jgi:hypothetical protein
MARRIEHHPHVVLWLEGRQPGATCDGPLGLYLCPPSYSGPIAEGLELGDTVTVRLTVDV